jgi:hypothetical protein
MSITFLENTLNHAKYATLPASHFGHKMSLFSQPSFNKQPTRLRLAPLTDWINQLLFSIKQKQVTGRMPYSAYSMDELKQFSWYKCYK